MRMIQAFFMLLLFQFAGEMLHNLLHLALPGPVVGMVLLAGWLMLKPAQLAGPLGTTADGVLSWLGLLFVPAGAAVAANLAMLRREGLAAGVALFASTLLTLAVTLLVMHALERRRRAA